MEHNRKEKLLMIIALIFGMVSLSVGFAAFSISLNISSQASVTPSSDTFSVKFSIVDDSLVEEGIVPSSKTSGVTTSNGIIDNSTNPIITNLSANFTNPGQYVEYTFYARNEGEYTAYLNNINFIGDKICVGDAGTTESLVQSACDDINITVTIGGVSYTETMQITGHILNRKSSEQITVRLEYLSSGSSVDGAFSISFPNVVFVYSTVDNSSFLPSVEKVVKLESGDLNTPGSVVSIGDQRFYIIGAEGGNVKLLSEYNLYVGYSVDVDWNATPITNPTGIQDIRAIGYCAGGSNIGGTMFSYTGSSYEGSIVEGYVNAYKEIIEGDKYGVPVVEARLITKEELEMLGCISEENMCEDVPRWVTYTSYWSGSYNDASHVWTVTHVDGDFYAAIYNDLSGYGVRPVIIISSDLF